MPLHQTSRRTFTSTAASVAIGVVAMSQRANAMQDATAVIEDTTPVPVSPLGYISVRTRTLESAGARDQVNDMVVVDFAGGVEALEGFQGYVLGDVIDQPAQSLSILVLEEARYAEGFNAIAADFVGGIEDTTTTIDTVQWEGDLLIVGEPDGGETIATPTAAPTSLIKTDGYVAVRIHTSTPGTDSRDIAPMVESGFLPLISELAGFQGYLWFPIEGGLVAISFYDTEASAQQSNEAASEWAAEFVADFTDGNPEIINAQVVYANLPILASP